MGKAWMILMALLLAAQISLKKVCSANAGCDTCWLCNDADSQNAFSNYNHWFFTEMVCQGSCISYQIQPKSDGTSTDAHCARFKGFESCRGKGNKDKCDCIESLCNGSRSAFTGNLVSYVVGMIMLLFHVMTRA